VLPRQTTTGSGGGVDVNVATDLDSTDLGAKPQRTVRTRLVDETLL